MGFYGMPQVFGMNGLPCRYPYRHSSSRADIHIGTAFRYGYQNGTENEKNKFEGKGINVALMGILYVKVESDVALLQKRDVDETLGDDARLIWIGCHHFWWIFFFHC